MDGLNTICLIVEKLGMPSNNKVKVRVLDSDTVLTLYLDNFHQQSFTETGRNTYAVLCSFLLDNDKIKIHVDKAQPIDSLPSTLYNSIIFLGSIIKYKNGILQVKLMTNTKIILPIRVDNMPFDFSKVSVDKTVAIKAKFITEFINKSNNLKKVVNIKAERITMGDDV